MSKFLMPSLGADMESAILMEWLVKEGEKVSKGQVIAEVETSKGVIEIEVFEDGIVEKLLVEEETECKVGMPLAIISSSGENKEVEEVQEKEVKIEKTEEIKTETIQEKVKIEEKVANKEEDNTSHEERIKISPAARKKARDLGVDLTKITPKEGIIQLNQVESVSATKEKASKKEQKNDAMRQAIAAAMSRSNTDIPHYYLEKSINMTPALNYLEELNKHRGINDRILLIGVLVRAVVLALKEVPQLNGFWQNGLHQISEEIHPGIAIALRKNGLITPALLDAHDLNLNDLMKSMSDLITRTRSGKLRSSEMTKQTITITNLGDLGVESIYGIIYPPQLAVVGFGAIVNSPWAEGDALCVRKVMKATLAGDHRATDGRTGALFLNKLNQILQTPEEDYDKRET